MGKTSKSTKKFINSGQLKKTIDARKRQKQVKKRVQNKQNKKVNQSSKKTLAAAEDDEDEEEVETRPAPGKGKGKAKTGKMSVDDLLNAGFMDEEDDEQDAEEPDFANEDGLDSENEGVDEELDEEDDDADFASIDEFDDGETHLRELAQLAEKDPEFFKYLQENDKELLEFDPSKLPKASGSEDGEDDGDVEMEEQESLKTLTTAVLKKWQRALLEQNSLRALRQLLVAFRSAVYMNDSEKSHTLKWRIDDPSLYDKLVTTTLKFTPVVLGHHLPYKSLANGKFKPPTQTTKFKALQKLILSYFHNLINLLSQLTDNNTLQLAISESAKIVPYIITSRKTVKVYLKKCLELWSGAADSIRVSAFLAIRKLASANDDSILDNVLKQGFVPCISEIIKVDNCAYTPLNQPDEKYGLAFGYIRQLAIHLRNSMKVKTKDAYKQVYNWQYVHSLDFWSIVLGRACDTQGVEAASELQALIYPLVQVSLGAIRLISNNRSYPFHLHLIRSLLHVTRHTDTYVPISSCILPILTTPFTSAGRTKSSTLRPFDFEVYIRVPQQYVKTRVFTEGLVEEACFLLAEWLGSRVVQASIAFPEICVPVIVALRKALKSAKSSGASFKDVTVVKGLTERIEESAKWIEQARQNVRLVPGQMTEVRDWQRELKGKVDESPLGKYLKVQRKAREKKRQLVEKARLEEAEIVGEDSDE